MPSSRAALCCLAGPCRPRVPPGMGTHCACSCRGREGDRLPRRARPQSDRALQAMADEPAGRRAAGERGAQPGPTPQSTQPQGTWRPRCVWLSAALVFGQLPEVLLELVGGELSEAREAPARRCTGSAALPPRLAPRAPLHGAFAGDDDHADELRREQAVLDHPGGGAEPRGRARAGRRPGRGSRR